MVVESDMSQNCLKSISSPGCWVPVSINAGGMVSNTTTMAIAAPGAASCSDAGNPLSNLVRTAGTQAFIHVETVDAIENIETATPITKSLDQLYLRFYIRPNSPFNFDPYMSYPPAGTCLVHQTSGDAAITMSLYPPVPVSVLSPIRLITAAGAPPAFPTPIHSSPAP